MARLLGMTALAVLMGAGGAHAEDAPTKLGPIVVTATRSERPVSSTPGGVVIIEREDIVRQLQLSKDPACKCWLMVSLATRLCAMFRG